MLSLMLAWKSCTSCVTMPTRERKSEKVSACAGQRRQGVLPTCGVVKAKEKACQRGLAAARPPEHPSTRPSGSAKSTSRSTSGGSAEEGNCSARRCRQNDTCSNVSERAPAGSGTPRPSLTVGLKSQQLAHAAHAGACPLKILRLVSQSPPWERPGSYVIHDHESSAYYRDRALKVEVSAECEPQPVAAYEQQISYGRAEAIGHPGGSPASRTSRSLAYNPWST